MADNDVLLHQEDELAYAENFDFSDAIFELTEPNIPKLSNVFSTPSSIINSKFKSLDKLLKLAHINARSVPKHIYEIEKIVSDTSFDILGVSETFISPTTPESIYQLPGYNFINKSRDKKCRGGVGIYVKENLPYKIIKLPVEFVQPEMVCIEVTVGLVKIAVIVIYKSPLIPYSVYASIHENLVSITSKYEHFLIMGDMNVNHLQPDSPLANFLQII